MRLSRPFPGNPKPSLSLPRSKPLSQDWPACWRRQRPRRWPLMCPTTKSCRWTRRATSRTTRWLLPELTSGRWRVYPRKSERPRRRSLPSLPRRGKFSYLKCHINTVFCACSVQAASGNGPSLEGLAKILIGEGLSAREPLQKTFWTITTANVTSWKSGQLMLETIPRSDFWAIQETHLSGRGRLATAQRWARRKGWATFFQAAEETGLREAASRGGVAMGGPTHISSEVPACFEATLDDAVFMAPAGVQRPLEYLRSRILARHINAIGGVTLVTVYLCLGFDGPWIAMGDWNMEPTELAQAGWVDLLGGKVVAPDTVTCACGAGSLINYFVVSAAIAHLVQQVQVIDESPTTPHWPVRLTRPGGTEFWLAVGPRLSPPSCPSGLCNRRPHSTGPGRRAASQRTSHWPGWSGFGQPRPSGVESTTYVVATAGRSWAGAKGWSFNTSPSARLPSKTGEGAAAGRQRLGVRFRRLVAQAAGRAVARQNGRGDFRKLQRSLR